MRVQVVFIGSQERLRHYRWQELEHHQTVRLALAGDSLRQSNPDRILRLAACCSFLHKTCPLNSVTQVLIMVVRCAAATEPCSSGSSGAFGCLTIQAAGSGELDAAEVPPLPQAEAEAEASFAAGRFTEAAGRLVAELKGVGLPGGGGSRRGVRLGVRLAECHRRARGFDAAMAAVGGALAGQPSSVAGLVEKGKTLLDMGRPAAAIRVFEQLLRLEREDVAAGGEMMRPPARSDALPWLIRAHARLRRARAAAEGRTAGGRTAVRFALFKSLAEEKRQHERCCQRVVCPAAGEVWRGRRGGGALHGPLRAAGAVDRPLAG